MYTKEFYDIVDKYKTDNKEEYCKLEDIIRYASYKFLIKKENGTLEEYLNFSIEDKYIEECDLLNELNITVKPRFFNNTNCETLVTFPTKLFKYHDRNKVLKKV